MSDRQAWQDFQLFVVHLYRSGNEILRFYSTLLQIERQKIEIMDNPQRKAHLKQIVDIHPDYSVDEVAEKYVKLMKLKTFLESNGFVEIPETPGGP